MNRANTLFGFILTLAIILFFLVVITDLKRAVDARAIEKAWKVEVVDKLSNLGTVSNITVTPIVNWHASDPQFKTEAGVSYLIEADGKTILFDLGFNQSADTPSPLEHNMQLLEISLGDVDTIFLSHAHRDHMGGAKWSNAKTFSTGTLQPSLIGKRVIAPVSLTYPYIDVEVIHSPTKLWSGAATTGPISRRLFIGQVEEQAFVLNLEGKGLVVFVGCGHQTVDKLIKRIDGAFDVPLYAIIGDLHYPLPEGRLKLLGVDAQRRLASGKGIFSPVTEVNAAIDMTTLNERLGFIMLGGHDTSDEMLQRFSTLFGDRFVQAEVGNSISIH